MATRTTYPGGVDAQTGDVLTETIVSSLPGGWVGYAEITSSQASITSITDLTGLSVTFTALATRKYRVTAEVAAFSTVGGDSISLYIANGASTALQVSSLTAATSGQRMHLEYIVASSAGSTTFKLRMGRTTGTGDVTCFASATQIGFILIEDIGASS